MLISPEIRRAVESQIETYSGSRLEGWMKSYDRPYAIKFIGSEWAAKYHSASPLKISAKPALTWGTATYVTPIVFPLSSALYGRIGVVAEFDPASWRIFDATKVRARAAYLRWARSQPMYTNLLLTVHSTLTNHTLRDQFRRHFRIDCVLFHPDQEAEIHTDRANHVWMAVTDWADNGTIDPGFSKCLTNPRFTVLIDEEFKLKDDQNDVPIRQAPRQIEATTERFPSVIGASVRKARRDPSLPAEIIRMYQAGGYIHVFIEP